MKPDSRIRDYDQPGWNAGYREGQAERADLEAANSQLRNEVRALKARIRRLTKDAT